MPALVVPCVEVLASLAADVSPAVSSAACVALNDGEQRTSSLGGVSATTGQGGWIYEDEVAANMSPRLPSFSLRL